MKAENDEPTELDDGFVEETWVYAGQRFNDDGKVVHAWRDPSGKERLYLKAPGHSVGYRYGVVVKREGGSTWLRGKPHYLGGEPSEDAVLLQAKDQQTKAQLALIRAERRTEKSPELEALTAPFARAAEECKRYEDLEALVNAVTSAMRKAWYSKGSGK